MTDRSKCVDDERIQLYQRLTQRKDKILEATLEIEDLRRKYINQNQKDEDASIESEIYKNIYTIIECLSEIIGYTRGKARGAGIYDTLINYTIYSRSQNSSRFCQRGEPSQAEYDHIAGSQVLDALCTTVNAVTITWSLKRDPIANLGNLESLIQLFRQGR